MHMYIHYWFPRWFSGKESTCWCRTEEAMAPHSSTLAQKIPWREEPGRLQSMGSLGVGHDWATSLSLFTFMHWRRKWQPLQCSCLENPRDGGAWWAAVYGVAQSRTRLKQLSSSSSSWCRKHRRCRFSLWVGTIPWRRKRQPTPVFLPGKSHGQKGLVDCSPGGWKRVGHD